MIKEKDFIQDPCGKIESLQSLPKDVVERKVEALAYAQQVMFPDHKESLFVPALLREAQLLEMGGKMRIPAISLAGNKNNNNNADQAR